MTKKQWQLIAVLSFIWFVAIVIVHYTFDFRLTDYVQATFNPQSRFIAFVHQWSHLGLGWPYLVGLGLLFLFAWFVLHKRKLAFCALYLWLSVAISGIVCDILKELFGRPRPRLLFNHHISHFIFLGHRQFHAADYASFPSGHATTAAAFAIGMILLLPRVRVLSLLFILFMLSVAAARILLLEHYAMDVMAGMYLGTLTSVILYVYMQKRFAFHTQEVAL